MNKRIGVMNRLGKDRPYFAELLEFGLGTCQLVSWDPELWTEERAAAVKSEIEANDISVSALWAGWNGPKTWDFLAGPDTLGIVPIRYRDTRVAELKAAGVMAKWLGVPAVITHLGFIPENPTTDEFRGVVSAVKEIALEYLDAGVEFWFETGQETPVTMLRLIETVGTGNLGINLDPANLILYGKGNPIDALDVFGAHVRNIHAKDGLYPTQPDRLGREVKVGQGAVRFPEFVEKLEKIGFTGEYIIEREISGEEQKRDIRATVEYLDKLLQQAKVHGNKGRQA